ncbi:MAG: type II toxin-antitoxin system VapC family toxin [Gemmataceae bacterium]|nr:type II toxin-antitoxin system VapC family toxin [Gemmataceae bacterium]MCI0741979.1 type II toxin-antitoxin system VapC family toxin [Gemmataceae bacterium]
MRLLLDTHAFLWFVLKDAHLSATAANRIVDPNNEILVSPASYWEIAIKISIGKYKLNAPLEAFITKALSDNGFVILPIEPRHAAALSTLPFHHRDPFDRILIAQAMVEQISVISGDPALDAYPVKRVW